MPTDSSVYRKRKRSSCGNDLGRKQRAEYVDETDEGHFEFSIGDLLAPGLKITRFIGEGTFARVVECAVEAPEGDESPYSGYRSVAVKVIRNVNRYHKNALVEADIIRRLWKEAVPSQTEVPVVRVLEVFKTKDERHLCLVFPVYGHSIFDVLKKNGFHGMRMANIRSMARRMLQCVAYLHERKCVHTDLKPENLLLGRPDDLRALTVESKGKRRRHYVPDAETPIICADFGSAVFLDDSEDHRPSIVCTRHYRPPEVVLDGHWGEAVDLWSIGCILFEMYTGDTLFQTHCNREHLVLMEKRLGPIPDLDRLHGSSKAIHKYFDRTGCVRFPDRETSGRSIEMVKRTRSLEACIRSEHGEFLDLLKQLLSYDPARRIRAKDALQHSFFD